MNTFMTVNYKLNRNPWDICKSCFMNHDESNKRYK